MLSFVLEGTGSLSVSGLPVVLRLRDLEERKLFEPSENIANC